ncbi:dihydrofolate reductase family protein [Corynebacterium sp. S7]
MFYDLAFGENPHYKHQGWISGRVTTDDNFTHYKKPQLDGNAPEVPEGDFIANRNADKYYIAIDASGKLAWESSEMRYQTTDAHVLEVLTNKASNAYKAFLRNLGVSYVICGDESIDWELLLDKLGYELGMDTVMLGGGGVINWSFIQEGLCDELSVVVAPVADGSSDQPSLFETAGRTSDAPRGFKLKSAEVKENDSVWLRYTVDNK